MSNPTLTSSTEVKSWDPLVKLTHWGVAGLVVVNALVVEEGSGWHIWAGYALAALLALRLLWGFVGPHEARFTAFPPSPRRALEHVFEIRRGEVKPHHSHNPLGALMVYALWLCLGTIIATGIAMAGPPPVNPNAGESHEHEMTAQQAYAEDDDGDEATESSEDADEGTPGGGGEQEEDVLEEIHEVAVNLLYVLIALHLLGVIFETRRSGRGLVLRMVPGHGGRRR